MDERYNNRYRILVCIDGSDEGYRGLRYAAKLSAAEDTDIVLCYVRPVDQGLRSGGLQVRVARENMLQWGLELPGITYLKKGQDMLTELGLMDGDWKEKVVHLDAYNDPLGDNKIEYYAPDGRMVVLKLKVAPTITTGILDQFELAPYDMIILGASDRWRTRDVKSFLDPAVAEDVAIHVPCPVIVSRDLDAGHGHLICVDGSEESLLMAQHDAVIAARCNCEISLLSVAGEEKDRDAAHANVAAAKSAIEELELTVKETLVRVGDIVEEIVETGPDYSLIVVGESRRGSFRRMMSGSVPLNVLRKAHNSVMICR